MKWTTAASAILLLAMPGRAQSRKTAHRTEPDRLGMTCTQVLQFTSSEWVAKYAAKSHPGAESSNGAAPSEASGDVIRAITAYGQCYEARTNRLAAVLGRKGTGPLMGARGDFHDFENSLEQFEAIALANAQPPANDTKKAYAALYEKQFRYAFYQSYEPAAVKPAPSEPSTKKPASARPPLKPGESSSLKSGAADSAGPDDQKSDDNSVAQFTKTKNRFGQLLEALPEDKSRQVHEAFGNILGAYEMSQDTRRDVYLYAIFLLEPDSAKPFAPPPF